MLCAGRLGELGTLSLNGAFWRLAAARSATALLAALYAKLFVEFFRWGELSYEFFLFLFAGGYDVLAKLWVVMNGS